ncbi:hypothetical protein [Aeromonas salmonicida]|uniref:hypothetical protein n=1 Tax=Aeromonas salmonicida TaxID=645 RepID=UPI00073C2330|nr:hypothetical protein [Aeromonas salmonicida]EKP0277953.1 hypothetical protein [Aeromonas bestiarum]KTA82120.1 hypothetical protein VO69_08875 [Aeromonas salmonicida]MDE7527335.1 hypothetical protein [Aeromonas salmonicida]MDE7531668.1 hypothetical protein [Aeromonas salmonicida]
MLSLMAALAALLCLLLTVAGLFKPALLGQKRRLNAFFIGLYGSLGFLILGMVLDGKIELSGGLVLLALLAAVHSILLFISHSRAVLKMSKEERSQARPGKAAVGVIVLFLAAGAGAWLALPAPLDAPMPPAESAKVQSAQQLSERPPAKSLRALSHAEQCRLEQDIYQQMNQVTDGVMARFGGLLDGQQIDYHQIAEYRFSTVNPAISAASDSMNGLRTSHMDEDVVIRHAASLVQRTYSFVGQLYTAARTGDDVALKSARDQLAQAIASHKQALEVCNGR